MEKPVLILVCIALLVAGTCIAGCTSTAPALPSATTTPLTTPTPAPVTAIPDYTGRWTGVAYGVARNEGFYETPVVVFNFSVQKGRAITGTKEYTRSDGMPYSENFYGVISQKGDLVLGDSTNGYTYINFIDPNTLEARNVEAGADAKAFSMVLTRQVNKNPSHGTWTFVVFGDSRDITRDTLTGVSPYLNPIAVAVAAEKPDLVMYDGDLVSGWIISNSSPVATDYQAQFQNWMDAVAPIHNYTQNSGTPLYVMRGNHEDGPDQTVMPLLDAYRNSVAAGMPTNGPPGEERLTYSFTWKGAKFIAIDEYFPHDGKKETVNQTWVDKELTSNVRPFTFVFGHTPAYPVKNDIEDLGYDIAIHPALRDVFWNSLVNHNATAYFSGHAHLYARGVNQGLQQVVAGNGGAIGEVFNQSDVDPALTIEYPVKEANKAGKTVGYVVVTVNETEGTMRAVQKEYILANGTWQTGDQFTLSRLGAVISNT